MCRCCASNAQIRTGHRVRTAFAFRTCRIRTCSKQKVDKSFMLRSCDPKTPLSTISWPRFAAARVGPGWSTASHVPNVSEEKLLAAARVAPGWSTASHVPNVSEETAVVKWRAAYTCVCALQPLNRLPPPTRQIQIQIQIETEICNYRTRL